MLHNQPTQDVQGDVLAIYSKLYALQSGYIA